MGGGGLRRECEQTLVTNPAAAVAHAVVGRSSRVSFVCGAAGHFDIPLVSSLCRMLATCFFPALSTVVSPLAL